jgi:hypothetical protein
LEKAKVLLERQGSVGEMGEKRGGIGKETEKNIYRIRSPCHNAQGTETAS